MWLTCRLLTVRVGSKDVPPIGALSDLWVVNEFLFTFECLLSITKALR